jgi:hypothetical protein
MTHTYKFKRPIHTYRGSATTGRYVQSAHHVQVYSTRHRPNVLHGEQGLQQPAIKVNLESYINTDLKPTSRICLTRPDTIHHNTSVAPVGRISDDDLKHLKRLFISVNRLKNSDSSGEDDDEDDDQGDDSLTEADDAIATVPHPSRTYVPDYGEPHDTLISEEEEDEDEDETDIDATSIIPRERQRRHTTASEVRNRSSLRTRRQSNTTHPSDKGRPSASSSNRRRR